MRNERENRHRNREMMIRVIQDSRRKKKLRHNKTKTDVKTKILNWRETRGRRGQKGGVTEVEGRAVREKQGDRRGEERGVCSRETGSQ